MMIMENAEKGLEESENHNVEIQMYRDGRLFSSVQLKFTPNPIVRFRIGEAFGNDESTISRWLYSLREETLVRWESVEKATVSILPGACATLLGPTSDDMRILEPQDWVLQLDEKLELVMGALKFVVQWTGA